MHSTRCSALLWISSLVAFALNGKAEVQQFPGKFAATALVVLPDLTNVTSLNDRFTDLAVNYDLLISQVFFVNQIALGFINAMKIQALEDFDQHITNYAFIDTEYADDPIRIRVEGAAGAPESKLVRCNIMYAIKTLAVDLLTRGRNYGAVFSLSYNGQPIYNGIFDNKNEAALLEPSSNTSANLSEISVQKKGPLSLRSLNTANSSSTLLSIPGFDDVEYYVKFDLLGRLLTKAGFFSAILEFMFTLAQRDSADSIEAVSQATGNDLPWIFVRHARSDFQLQGFELLGILEGMARHVVSRGSYMEVVFSFYINGDLVATGCVTKPSVSRRWCHGLVGESS